MPKNTFAHYLVFILIGIGFCAWGSGSSAQELGYVEDFNDPALPGWERTSNAQVADGLLRIEGEGFALRSTPTLPTGLILRLRLEGDGFLEVRYQVSNDGMSIVRINHDEIVLLREIAGSQVVLASTSVNLASGEWWRLEMSMTGGEQHAFLAPGIELHTADAAVLPAGGLMLHTFGDATVEFDDLSVVTDGDKPVQAAAPVVPLAPVGEPPLVGELTWIRTGGPPGGLGYDIRYNFENPDTWYVTDANAGVHISTDNGLTWQPANEGILHRTGSTGDAIPIFSLTVDPIDPRIVWAGTQGTGHIYRSTDGGWTWEERDNGVVVEHDALTFRGFTVDPRSSNVVYALGEINSEALGGPSIWGNGTGGVIYKTSDGGSSWVKLWDGGIPSSLARYLWIDPTDSDILFASTGIFDRGAVGEGDPATDPFGGLGILASTDGGNSWIVQGEANGLRMLYLGSLYMHPQNPRVLLAAAGHVSTGIAEHADYLRSIGEASPSGVYRTEDGGLVWRQVLVPPHERTLEAFSSVEICPGDPSIAYAASEARVYRSEDGGLSWDELPAGVTGWGPPNVITGFPIDIQCDPRDSNRLFINNYGGGNFLSEDGGLNWRSASDGYTGAIIRGLAVDPQNNGTVYTAGPSGIWLSLDGGGHWEGIANSTQDVRLDLDWNVVVVDPSDSQHVLLAGSPEVFASSDGGSSWRKAAMVDRQGMPLEGEGLAGMSPISTITYAPSNPMVVYAGFADGSCIIFHEPCPPTGGSVLISQDGGETWRLEAGVLPDDAAVFDLGIDPIRAQVVFAGTQAGLFRSDDGGMSWQRVAFGPANPRVSAVAIDPLNGDHILASVDQAGLWESMDGGKSWVGRVTGLEPNPVIHDILFVPGQSSMVFLNDNASGAYQSLDGGITWERINTGLTMRAVTGIAFSSDGAHLYTGTQGGGIFRLDLHGQPPVSSIRATITPAEQPFPSVEAVPDGSNIPAAPEERSQGIALYIGGAGFVILLAVLVLFAWTRRASHTGIPPKE